jgi:beta-1,4-mannosyl-glycoprotein beta-1,4-N-acetylglucosaminyltransferase
MIYDCFLYYDEDMLLDIRLNTLADHIDRFVIVESTHTFTGKSRQLHFDITKFSQFKDKIIYVVYDKPPIMKASNPSEVDAWANEAAQRNAIMDGLTNADDADIILVSDVDEIFNPCVIDKINASRLCTTIYMNFYNYQFNMQVFNTDESPRQCKAPKAASYKNLKGFFLGEPETLRNMKKSKLRKSLFKWKWYKLNNKIITNGGWHFSWIMTPERISEKMTSISHTEYDLPEFNNKDHIVDALNNAKDIWGRDRSMVKQELNKEKFPGYLVDNKEKFASFII